jgi:hypothetical protein
METIPSLESPYDRSYYSGIAWERRAKSLYGSKGIGSSRYVYGWIVKALQFFEEAERLRPAGDDSSILRWNACIRFLEHHKELAPMPEESPDPILSE